MKCSGFVFVCLLVGLCSAADYSRTVSYEGELVIRCDMKSSGIAKLLSHDLVDVWSVTADHADIRLTYSLYQRMRHRYPLCSALHSSVENLVREAEKTMATNVTAGWFEEYHTYEEIVQWYKDLAKDYPDTVKYVESIGKSFEGRDMPAVHISAKDDAEMVIYFQCQIHAREWISGATCMYIANQLVTNKAVKDGVKFVFVPFVNPDGYEYTWTNNRLWRKNCRVNSGSSCPGVDLNRNYNDHWGGGGSSSNPCSDTYHGSSPASEPETQNTQNYFRSSGNIVGAIDWHSYSQLILRPYGWTTSDSPDEAQLKELGDGMREAIQGVHGKVYTSQKSIDLYPTTGTASDWFYSDDANKNNEYRAAGYTIELRDTGRYGFLLPPDQIIPTGEEIYPAVLAFAEELTANPLKK